MALVKLFLGKAVKLKWSSFNPQFEFSFNIGFYPPPRLGCRVSSSAQLLLLLILVDFNSVLMSALCNFSPVFSNHETKCHLKKKNRGLLEKLLQLANISWLWVKMDSFKDCQKSWLWVQNLQLDLTKCRCLFRIAQYAVGIWKLLIVCSNCCCFICRSF